MTWTRSSEGEYTEPLESAYGLDLENDRFPIPAFRVRLLLNSVSSVPKLTNVLNDAIAFLLEEMKFFAITCVITDGLVAACKPHIAALSFTKIVKDIIRPSIGVSVPFAGGSSE
jgi:hypothetical protein